MTDLTSYMLLGTAVFAGAFVSGMAGFAFSAVAGAILFHVFQPSEAVPLMMACSVGVQASTLLTLRQHMRWRESLFLIAGGLLALPIAVFLLQSADTRSLQMAFGGLITAYAAYSLFRPALSHLPTMDHQGRNMLIGFGGGLIGGLTAMPGALPTMWCDLHGLTKLEQRGAVQPFIMIMQFVALALLLPQVGYSPDMLFDFVVSAPGLAAGTVTGVVLFGRVDDATFRRVVLTALLVSGIMLVL